MIKHYWFQFKRNVLSYLFGYGCKWLMRAILLTCRIELHGLEQFTKTASKGKCILMLWHNRIAIVPDILTRFTKFLYAAVISNSRDGEFLAILVNSYKVGKIIRVSHDSRHEALHQLINHLKNSQEIVVITPDGPKGPRYGMKPGLAVAAKKANASVVPLSWTASKYWQLKTWDKLMIPKPFSTIRFSIGSPLKLTGDRPNNLHADIVLLEETLANFCRELDPHLDRDR